MHKDKRENLDKIIKSAHINMVITECWIFKISLKDTLKRVHNLGYTEFTIFDIKREFNILNRKYSKYFLQTKKD